MLARCYRSHRLDVTALAGASPLRSVCGNPKRSPCNGLTLNLSAHTLRVRRTVHRVTGVGLVYEEPKTDRSRRTVALPGHLAAALRAHREAQLAERGTVDGDQDGEDLVFTRPDGRPIDKSADYHDWRRLLRDAGVGHVRLHDARHTAATLLLAENVHPRVVMELLGHSQMRTTTDIYSHVLPPLARDAADRMNAVLLTPIDTPTQ